MPGFPKLKSSFMQHVLTLLKGTVTAQVLTLLAAPILTRYYAPEDFATAELYLRISLLIGVVASARYELAIVLPRENRDALGIARLSMVITLGFVILTAGLVIVGNHFIAELFKIGELAVYLYLLPISVLLLGFYQIFNYWHIRNKYFWNLSLANFSNSLINNGTKISLGIFSALGPLGLILGTMAGQVLGMLLFLKKSSREVFFPGEKITKTLMLENARTHRDFPRINLAHAFSDAFRELIISAIILLYFGGVAMGLYAFVVRIIKMPISLIGISVSQVFFQRASETYSADEDLYGLVRKTLWTLFKIGFPALILFMFFGDMLFDLLFAEKWDNAGLYAQILAPWLFFNFLISPVSQIPIIVNKQKEVFLLSLLGLAASVLSLVLGKLLFGEAQSSLLLFSIVQSIYLVFVILWILKISRLANLKSKI